MRIVLCHNCWGWVPLDSDRCPECHHGIDLNAPDPSPMQLAELFGAANWRLGSVRCERKQLPSLGLFLGTTGGLMFLPELTLLPNGAREAVEQRTERFWPLPRWWLWGRRTAESAVPDEFPVDPFADLSHLAERFLESPGAAFVPHHQLIRAALRGRTWTVSRTVGCTLRFTALSSAEEARQTWREMLSRDPAWRELAASGR